MATVVNNPGTTTPVQNGSGTNFLVGVILLIVFALIVIFYGIPFLANTASNTVGTAPQVQVPEKVDVNVNQKPN